MSDDSTTWLKKNPSINPLQRSLKTSLRFHVSSSDLNASIMPNPDKAKDQGLFIPRMLQRSNVQMRKSRAFEFKVPELVASESGMKKQSSGAGVKPKKMPTPKRVRKSFLPIPKTKQAVTQTIPRKSLPRPSVIPGTSGRTAKRELIRKVVELSEIKRKEAESQLKAVSGDSPVLRSILKKRASLRRSSQILKPKAKKVLFDRFENGDGDKENEADCSLKIQNDFDTALDEPTVFLNFPNGTNIYESPFEATKEPLNWTVEETKPPQDADVGHIIKLWESYQENLENIQTARKSVEESFESLLLQCLSSQKQYQTYKETSEEIYSRLSKLGEEMNENLKKLTSVNDGLQEDSTPASKRPGRRGSQKVDKIKISYKSKAIKKSSGRKSVPPLKKEFLEDGFSMISGSGFLDDQV